jgi:pimeloyl-ACP methyl ester carboxylesterase
MTITVSLLLPKPTESGFATAAEGLKVHYEVFGQGEPIVVLAGGLMDISGMDQIIGPLSHHRQVIGIDLEGHGQIALRTSPMSHERNGDDVGAVLGHLGIAKSSTGRARRDHFAPLQRSDWIASMTKVFLEAPMPPPKPKPTE